jgi:hypothetical protein
MAARPQARHARRVVRRPPGSNDRSALPMAAAALERASSIDRPIAVILDPEAT